MLVSYQISTTMRTPYGKSHPERKHMPKQISCGLLMYDNSVDLCVLLAHPGGPFFANKDDGSWSIPKGLVDSDDTDLLQTAKREFVEETGYDLSDVSEFLPLDSVKLKSGKLVHAWAFAGMWEDGRVPDSNTFTIEWPPRSGREQAFPEIDRAEMFSIDEARTKINLGQSPLLERLVERLGLS